MTQLLISVRNSAEALMAMAGGAHLIDIKEPANGPLGMADWQVCLEICSVIDGGRPVSIAGGELVDFSLQDIALDQMRQQVPAAVKWLKLGLSQCLHDHVWNGQVEKILEIQNALPSTCGLILATYADRHRAVAPTVPQLLARLEAEPETFRNVGILIDTFDKQFGRLLDSLTISELSAVATQCKQQGRTFALAGSLQPSDIAKLLPLQSDYLGFRSAACEAGRDSQISSSKIANLVQQLANVSQEAVTRKTFDTAC